MSGKIIKVAGPLVVADGLAEANENEPQSFQTSSPTCHQVPAERKQVLEMQNDVLEG